MTTTQRRNAKVKAVMTKRSDNKKYKKTAGQAEPTARVGAPKAKKERHKVQPITTHGQPIPVQDDYLAEEHLVCGIPDIENEHDGVFDETDLAQLSQLREQEAIAKQAGNGIQKQFHPLFDGRHCVDCAIEMPKVRLQDGRVRCRECQEEFDYLDKRKRQQGRMD